MTDDGRREEAFYVISSQDVEGQNDAQVWVVLGGGICFTALFDNEGH